MKTHYSSIIHSRHHAHQSRAGSSVTAIARVLLGWALLAVAIVTSHAQVTDGLIGWWNFDGDTNTVAVDSSGNGRNGTYANGATNVFVPDFNQVASFDGADDFISLPGSALSNLSAIS